MESWEGQKRTMIDHLGCHSTGCGEHHYGACCGGDCTGCHGTLQLTQGEISLLLYFAQVPFLPVAKRRGSDEPVYLEDGEKPAEEMARIITALQQKRLIRLDYDLPLSNFDYAAYEDCSAKGSMALTAMGQRVIEQLEIQGIGT